MEVGIRKETGILHRSPHLKGGRGIIVWYEKPAEEKQSEKTESSEKVVIIKSMTN
jgi:hypothetical protein